MTDYEMLLLRAAVEVCGTLGIEKYPTGWHLSGSEADDFTHTGPTLADALTDLLRDLGADVPEWPSEERVAEASERLGPVAAPTGTALHYLRALPLPEYLALRGGS